MKHIHYPALFMSGPSTVLSGKVSNFQADGYEDGRCKTTSRSKPFWKQATPCPQRDGVGGKQIAGALELQLLTIVLGTIMASSPKIFFGCSRPWVLRTSLRDQLGRTRTIMPTWKKGLFSNNRMRINNCEISWRGRVCARGCRQLMCCPSKPSQKPHSPLPPPRRKGNDAMQRRSLQDQAIALRPGWSLLRWLHTPQRGLRATQSAI